MLICLRTHYRPCNTCHEIPNPFNCVRINESEFSHHMGVLCNGKSFETLLLGQVNVLSCHRHALCYRESLLHSLAGGRDFVSILLLLYGYCIKHGSPLLYLPAFAFAFSSPFHKIQTSEIAIASHFRFYSIFVPFPKR